MRNYSVDYQEINAAAQRKWAADFCAPALTWHRAFWIRDLYEHGKTKEDFIKAHNGVKDTIDFAIRNFYYGLVVNIADRDFTITVQPVINNKIFLFHAVVTELAFDDCGGYLTSNLNEREKAILQGDGRVVTLKFNMKYMRITGRVELRAEYFCITIIAECSDKQELFRTVYEHYYDNIVFSNFRKHYNLLVKYFCDNT